MMLALWIGNVYTLHEYMAVDLLGPNIFCVVKILIKGSYWRVQSKSKYFAKCSHTKIYICKMLCWHDVL